MLAFKINWVNILILFVLAVASLSFLFLPKELVSKSLALIGFATYYEPAPVPTEIDQNFLTQVNECFIPTASVYGYTLRITSGFRSIEDQSQTFEQGRTENGHIVSWAVPGKSLHNYGLAVDVVDRWRGYNVDWKKLAKIGTFCGLEQVDDPHFEHRGGLATEDFPAGKRPSLLELPCLVMDQRSQADKPLTLKDLQDCGAPSF